MGCDIHVCVEYLKWPAHNDRSDWWSDLGTAIHLDRCYSIFGKLGNDGRGEMGAVPPRGLPEAISWKTKDAFEEDKGDAHTISWMTPDEWEAAIGGMTGDYKAILAMMRSLESDGYQARVVFWFDN